MSHVVTQSIAADLIAILTDSSGLPVTGLVYSDVTVQYRKEGAGSFTNKALTAPDFVELGSGIYTIAFTAAELDTLGSFLFKVTGASVSQFVSISTVVAAGATPTPISVNTCVISGHVLNPAGSPVSGVSVSARILGAPSIQNNYVLTGGRISVTTDAAGEFFISLIRLAQVEITISAVNYKRKLVVPNVTTANLFQDIP